MKFNCTIDTSKMMEYSLALQILSCPFISVSFQLILTMCPCPLSGWAPAGHHCPARPHRVTPQIPLDRTTHTSAIPHCNDTTKGSFPFMLVSVSAVR